jgi:hypothetical protein
LLAHGRWLSPGTPVSSTTKTGFHDIAVQNIAENGVQHQKSNQIILSTTIFTQVNNLG